MENNIGKFVFSFTPKGMADSFSPKTFVKSFTKEGEFYAYLEEMDERGYHFHDAWDYEEYMNFIDNTIKARIKKNKEI